MSKGYVYVLSNPCMPGIVKIGRSIHGGRGRADTFYRNDTGVPMPFELEFEILVPDAVLAERSAHKSLSMYRVNKAREFFRADSRRSIEIVMRAAALQFGLKLHQFPETIYIADEWDSQESVINSDLVSNGYEPAVESDFAIEISHFSMDTNLVIEAIKARQNYIKRQEAHQEKSDSAVLWELH